MSFSFFNRMISSCNSLVVNIVSAPISLNCYITLIILMAMSGVKTLVYTTLKLLKPRQFVEWNHNLNIRLDLILADIRILPIAGIIRNFTVVTQHKNTAIRHNKLILLSRFCHYGIFQICRFVQAFRNQAYLFKPRATSTPA